MRPHELEEGRQSAAFTVERVGRLGEDRRDMVADLGGHVADQLLEYRLLAVEVGVECAQGDAGAARDPDDRPFRKALLAELLERRVEDLAERSLAARRTWCLAVACGALCLVGRTRFCARIAQTTPLESHGSSCQT